MRNEKKTDSKIPAMKRRTFMAGALAASAFQIAPSYCVAKSKDSKPNSEKPPSEKLNLAIIGCSQRGGSIGGWAMSKGMADCVALCDVLPSRTNGFKNKYKDAKVYSDFRKMFDEMGGKIDACINGTPDHAHFPISMLAMANGASVYVEKPMAHTFEESELMMAAEKKYKVAGQMGNQGHSGNNYLQFKAWVEAGIIKNVRKIDACMCGGRRWHPWGDVKGYPPAEPMPDGMNWDVWAGTAAKHPYNGKFDKGNWRGWHIYGSGAMGDWAAHTIDTLHEFLKLGLPHTIRTEKLEGQNDFIFPMKSTIAFDFAERGPTMPAMTLRWFDGTGNMPPVPEELKAAGVRAPSKGKMIYGDDLAFMGGTHGSTLRIVPESKMKEMASKVPKITEKHSDHMANFLLSAMGKETCHSSFEVAGVLTQIFSLGCIAQRIGGTFHLDTKTKQITDNKRANELLKGAPPRKGWEEFYKLA